MLGRLALSTCAYPLGQVVVEDGWIRVGPAMDAFAISGLLTIVALLAVPPLGLVALLVLPLTYLTVPRWSSAFSELRVEQGRILGTLTGLFLYKSGDTSSVRLWLPDRSRLVGLLADRGMVAEGPPTNYPMSVGSSDRRNPKITALLSGLTAGVLLASAAVRVVQDIPLLKLAAGDALYAAVVASEVMVIVLAVALGLAAAFIAGRSWRRNIEMMIPSVIVSGLILIGGVLAATYAYPPARQAGWILIVLSGATLCAQALSRRPHLTPAKPNAR